jgi:hypothetical protein
MSAVGQWRVPFAILSPRELQQRPDESALLGVSAFVHVD